MQPGDVLADRFVLQTLAGSGGMGTVYRALDKETGATVAVKLLTRSGDGQGDRFVREAKMLSELRHPGIVQYIAHGVADQGLFLAMDWLEGEDLAQRLLRSRLTLSDTLTLGARVAETLAFAHARRVVHRDLKPSNLFLPGGAVDRVMLLDFGVARWDGRTHAATRTGALMGTPGYMAPEQARGSRVDARADAFSLGCVLFECITGQAPFVGDHLMAILAKIVLGDSPRLRDRRRDVPAALDALVASLMAREPDQRPADLATVAADLASLDSDVEFEATELVPKSSGGPLVMGHDEQRLLAVVLAGARQTSAFDATFTADSIDPALIVPRVEKSLESENTSVEAMVDGSVVAVVSRHTIASDLARDAARCALAMSALLPGHAIGLAIGRGVLNGRLPAGEVLDRAARLASTAPASSVAVDALTAALVAGSLVVGSEQGLLVLRGGTVEGLESGAAPFVGREHELRAITGAFAHCADEGTAQAVVVKAPAGMGKSRLAAELIRQLADRDDAPDIWTARGDGTASEKPYATLLQLLERAARTTPAAGDNLAATAGSIRTLALRRDAQASSEIARATGEVIARVVAARPLVVVLDDLQSVDPETVQLLDTQLRVQADQPLLVVGLGRPELDEVFPRLWVERGATEIRLGDLSRRAAEKLVRDGLGADVAAEQVAALVERSGGNPMLLSQLVRAEAGGSSGPIPDVVLAVLQARVEALEPASRRALRAASIYDDAFTCEGVAALLSVVPAKDDLEQVRALLDGLVDREVLTVRERGGGGARYAFSQELMRQAVRAMLTDADLRTGQALASEFLERHHAAAPMAT